jgi:hypothetical protein
MSSTWNVLCLYSGSAFRLFCYPKIRKNFVWEVSEYVFLFPANRYIPRKVIQVYLWNFRVMTSCFVRLVFRSFGECSLFKGESTSSLTQSILFNCLLIELRFSVLLHCFCSAFYHVHLPVPCFEVGHGICRPMTSQRLTRSFETKKSPLL